MEQQSFFSATKEKVYITIIFVGLRLFLGYLNSMNVQPKLNFFVNMILGAIDFVVSLPMKLVFATPAVKILTRYEIGALFLFALMIVYWYVFACVLVYAYETLNKQDEAGKQKEHIEEDKKDEVQSKLL